MIIVTRPRWGAQHGRGYETAGAKLEFFLHHSAVDRPGEDADEAVEAAEVRSIEAYHARTLTPRNPRIGYTFLVAPSGRVYEGTGWGRIGAHTGGRNSSSYAACLMMNGDRGDPTPAAIQAFNELRLIGVQQGHLHPRHALRGHRDASSTSCPGELVYPVTVLIAQAKITPPVEREAAVAPMPTLRKGKGGRRGPEHITQAVRELQRRLGMKDRHRTGYFGPITDAAVRDHQNRHFLLVDGIVGPRTWATLL